MSSFKPQSVYWYYFLEYFNILESQIKSIIVKMLSSILSQLVKVAVMFNLLQLKLNWETMRFGVNCNFNLLSY